MAKENTDSEEGHCREREEAKAKPAKSFWVRVTESVGLEETRGLDGSSDGERQRGERNE